MNTLRIELGDRGYDIRIGDGVLDKAGEYIAGACKGRSAAIVTNPRIGELYAARVVKSLEDAGFSVEVISVPAGERYKTLHTVSAIYEKVLDQRLDRGSILIGLGGGIVGDMTGFAAATFMRGIDFVQIPTSLLAQVDASIGGKTGVNLSRGKNLVGAFHQPKIVLADTRVLDTLPRREFRAGLAEIIKHGIIRDVDYFDFLEHNLPAILRLDPAALAQTIKRSCEIKAAVVREDEREAGLRRILNFGHTAGHAVERLTKYRKYKHGEAVAIGMLAAVLVARELGTAESALVDRVSQVIRRAELPCALPVEIEPQDIVTAMGFDKKVTHGRLHVVLANSIGQSFVADDISPETWLKALEAQKREF